MYVCPRFLSYNDMNIVYSAVCNYKNEKLIISDYYTNDIYLFDIREGKTELLCSISEEESKERLFECIVEKDGCAFLIPFEAKDLYVVNVNDKTYERIPVHVNASGKRFGCAYIINQSLFVFGFYAPEIIKISLDDYSVENCTSMAESIMNIDNHITRCYFRNGYVSEDYLYIPSSRANKMLVLNIKNNQSSVECIGETYDIFSDVCLIENTLWCAPCYNNNVLCYNFITGENKRIIYPEGYVFSHIGFRKIIYFKEYVYLFPYSGYQILRINVKSLKAECIISKKIMYLAYAAVVNEELFISIIQTKENYVIRDSICELIKMDMPKEQQNYRNMINSELYRMIHERNDIKKVIKEEYIGALRDYICFATDYNK